MVAVARVRIDAFGLPADGAAGAVRRGPRVFAGEANDGTGVTIRD